MKTFADAKLPGEKVILTFDFTSRLTTGESLTGVPAVGVTVRTGVDANPSTLLNGAPAIDVTGKLALVPVQSGVDATDYLITVLVPTSNPLKQPGMIGVLLVRS